ncbi:MAG: cation diffusion facilitator family transporter [Rhodospirillaceae bacterium]
MAAPSDEHPPDCKDGTAVRPHAHSHPHHHGDAHSGNERRLAVAAAITGLFMIAEVAGGVLSGSLALIADAGHMLTDFASLTLAWFAFRLSRRPADWKRTYGFDRFQIIVAFANGIALFLVAGWILYEAVSRLFEPVEIVGPVMAGVAFAGLVVNIAAFAILHGADRDNLNIRGAALHVLGDLLGSVAALAAAATIILTGWTPIDPILSVLVAALILRSAWRLVKESGHILLEGAPANMDVAAIAEDLPRSIDGVRRVHHLHAWSITQERSMLTLHADVAETLRDVDAIAAIKARLQEKFGIDHATVEIERS